MDKPQPKTSGWFELVRRIGESVAALMRNRLELFTVELQEEKLRWLELLLWLGLAMAIGAAGILLAIAALALWLWNVAGYA